MGCFFPKSAAQNAEASPRVTETETEVWNLQAKFLHGWRERHGTKLSACSKPVQVSEVEKGPPEVLTGAFVNVNDKCAADRAPDAAENTAAKSY